MKIKKTLAPEESWSHTSALTNLAAALLVSTLAIILLQVGISHLDMARASMVEGGQRIMINLSWRYHILLTIIVWWVVNWLTEFRIRKFLLRDAFPIAQAVELADATGGTQFLLASAVSLPVSFWKPHYDRWYALAVWRRGDDIETCRVHGRGIDELKKFTLAKRA